VCGNENIDSLKVCDIIIIIMLRIIHYAVTEANRGHFLLTLDNENGSSFRNMCTV
jgi:surface polysaccharide O-acyltransferase-like enzyme